MINSSGGQEVANYKYFIKKGYGCRFRTVFTFMNFMKKISNKPNILKNMQNNMFKNNNEKAMDKLYHIAIDVLKEE